MSLGPVKPLALTEVSGVEKVISFNPSQISAANSQASAAVAYQEVTTFGAGATGPTGPTGVGTVGATGIAGIAGTAGATGPTGPGGVGSTDFVYLTDSAILTAEDSGKIFSIIGVPAEIDPLNVTLPVPPTDKTLVYVFILSNYYEITFNVISVGTELVQFTDNSGALGEGFTGAVASPPAILMLYSVPPVTAGAVSFYVSVLPSSVWAIVPF